MSVQKRRNGTAGEEEKGGKDMCLHKIETYGKFFFDQVNSKTMHGAKTLTKGSYCPNSWKGQGCENTDGPFPCHTCLLSLHLSKKVRV